MLRCKSSCHMLVQMHICLSWLGTELSTSLMTWFWFDPGCCLDVMHTTSLTQSCQAGSLTQVNNSIHPSSYLSFNYLSCLGSWGVGGQSLSQEVQWLSQKLTCSLTMDSLKQPLCLLHINTHVACPCNADRKSR